LRANAGSGKTRTLVNRVARLLLKGAKADRILCLTFTKAAANEMQARLFQTLGQWAVSDDQKLEAELLSIGEDRPDLNEARSLFARALETPGGLKIQTLHAFCEKLLRRFPLEAGIAPGFRVLDEALAQTLKTQVRRSLFEVGSDEGFCEARDRLILRLGELGFDNLLTSFMHRRHFFKQWLARFSDHDDALDTIKQSLGLDHDLSDPFGVEIKNLLGSNDGRTALEALANEKAATPQKLAASLSKWAHEFEANEEHFLRLMDHLFTAANTRKANIAKLKIVPDFIETLFTEIEIRFQYLNILNVAIETNDARLVLDKIKTSWDELTTALGVVSFDDQIEFANTLLNDADMAQWVRFKLDEGLEHILVDEAQDTSEAQWSIISPLADEFFVGEGQFEKRWRTYFAVGDEKQSIYGFQGADPQSFRSEEARIREKASQAQEEIGDHQLSHSFRSLPAILQLVDQVFNHPQRAFSVTLDQGHQDTGSAIDRPIIRHIPWREAPFGRVELYPLLRAQIDDGSQLNEDQVDGQIVKTVDEQLAWQIANNIKSALDNGMLIHDKNTKRPLSPGDILVLVRDRNSVFEHLIRALKTLSVPIAGADRLKLENHIVFKDLRALMRVAVSPEDDFSLALLLRSPFIGLSEDDLLSLSERSKNQSLWQSLCAADGYDEAKTFIGWAYESARRDSVFDFCAKALERRCSSGLSMRQRIFIRMGAECEDVVVEALNLAAFCEKQGIMSVAAALAWFEYHASEIKREQGANGPQSVRIMTVHGAKGLEAPWVIVVEKIKAKKQNRDNLICRQKGGALVYVRPKKTKCPDIIKALIDEEAQNEDHEHMRLLYVALTRACDRLSLYSAQGSRNVSDPSGGHWYEAVSEALGQLKSNHQSLVNEEMVTAYCDYENRDNNRITIMTMGSVEYDPDLISKSASELVTIPTWALGPKSTQETSLLWQAAGRLGEAQGLAQEVVLSPLMGVGSVDNRPALGLYGRGLIIHRLLETLPECPPDAQEGLLVKLLARQMMLNDDQRAEIYKATISVLQHPEFQPLFGPGSRPEVALSGEIGIDCHQKPVLVNGQVDRLVVNEQGVWVLDYKTNQPAPERAEKAPVLYVRQLAAYVALLQKIYPNRPVHAAFLWTDGPRLMPLSPQLIEKTLNDILGH